MDVIFTIVGILGLGALVISIYVFLLAARRYVSEDTNGCEGALYADNNHAWQPRSGRDRRQNRQTPTFPFMLNGTLIERERRRGERRRRQAS